MYAPSRPSWGEEFEGTNEEWDEMRRKAKPSPYGKPTENNVSNENWGRMQEKGTTYVKKTLKSLFDWLDTDDFSIRRNVVMSIVDGKKPPRAVIPPKGLKNTNIQNEIKQIQHKLHVEFENLDDDLLHAVAGHIFAKMPRKEIGFKRNVGLRERGGGTRRVKRNRRGKKTRRH
jgi:hypothetical protein